ncbi:hypothetical protein [Endozoicomonas sp. ONNA2]|uniref:hypothetical protein n=1 Tax=Endozoicomonas sp. ONNA2 TaxID=2828741 RepID=UPI0021479A2D|nr:hypothetical protein [Endozoicomonas sp. ONNA2]
MNVNNSIAINNLPTQAPVADVKGGLKGVSVTKADVSNQLPEAKGEGPGKKSIEDFKSITALSMGEVSRLLTGNQIEMKAIQDALNKFRLDPDAGKNYELIHTLNQSVDKLESTLNEKLTERNNMVEELFAEAGRPINQKDMTYENLLDNLANELSKKSDQFGSSSVREKANNILDYIKNEIAPLEKTISETRQQIESENTKPQELKKMLEDTQNKIMEESRQTIDFVGDNIIKG